MVCAASITRLHKGGDAGPCGCSHPPHRKCYTKGIKQLQRLISSICSASKMESCFDRTQGLPGGLIRCNANRALCEMPVVHFLSRRIGLPWFQLNSATERFCIYPISKCRTLLIRRVLKLRKSKSFCRPWLSRLLLVTLYFAIGQAQQIDAPQATTQAPAPIPLPSSIAPSWIPSIIPSVKPSTFPSSSAQPTLSFVPSSGPSQSKIPSALPSFAPTLFPTLTALSSRRANYQQEFIMPEDDTFFTSDELSNMTVLFNNYTEKFAPEHAMHSTTNCTALIGDQQKFSIDGTDRARLILLYNCLYSSRRISVLDFPDLYVAFVNGNLDNFTSNVQTIVPRLFSANTVVSFAISTEAPTTSPYPTFVPTDEPTYSDQPSLVPSELPTEKPVLPTASPTDVLLTLQPAPPPTSPPTDRKPVGLISGVVVGAGVLGLAALVALYFYLKMKQRQENASRQAALDKEQVVADEYPSYAGGDDREANNVSSPISPSDSLLSQKSLLSHGDSVLDDKSTDELDGTKGLQDEFDQFRDQTLEQFRSNVEGSLAGFEGIMSAAVTKALMGDDDIDNNPTILLWGCQADPSSVEIEASALCEVNDWLKRNESSSAEKKRLFMNDIINRMLATTRSGYLRADDASRTVHESAALLGLPLANELSMTTVLFSGMRKTIEASDMVKVLREFGDIDVAAVASGQRGFGLVRYRNSKSVEKALRRYRDGEIVIQDVAVQMKVLQPSGTVDS
ncbi:hypothetical protein FisN_12Hh277 [Fistulifera solaris]|uniref:RRM domain-containing protein n=1 Tax=Fistulifera solaris TaxID=1519565 RepID=A0A1Z5KBM9_FISSO|nr:hypothetical protein FisN_12Hh277 [Fistulifera solaris]|eukprot:GAX23700.1 hypothetical protein FisN_12Hh277 [Fistulifera solaris]